jgi:diguanylate cyclase (GGDEF)-like protein
MENKDLAHYIENSGKDPSRLIFEDELTGLYNRRYLYHYLQTQIDWEKLDRLPVSLLMMDLDHFKQINDNYGHQTGDQALIWLSGHLKRAAGSNGMPIRYAGDEFMILIKDSGKQTSLETGTRLIQTIRDNPFKTNGDQNAALHLTISLGIATAPEDARNSKTLIQKADTALYSAKQNGRDQLVNAGDVLPEDVFAKTAIFQLKEVQIVGRGRQLSLVAEALKKYSARQNQFLIAEGKPGIGKTEFLETVRRNLANSKTTQVSVNGIAQEMLRPYYLTEKLLVDLFSQRDDTGEQILGALKPIERAYLSRILPQIQADPDATADKDERSQREGLFNTLVQIIPKLVDFHPLIVFADDLHFADEATLLLLRRLMLRGKFPLFVCGTASETSEHRGESRMSPLDQFYDEYQQELDIQKFTLDPLSAADIARHIQSIFPNVRIPEGFETELAEVTQGNPLFFGEILRKLVLDHKIILSGQQWVIQPLETGYLPNSIEEIVTEKIAALDEESRQMLDQVSALGEDVSLSMLIGSSELMEAKVLDFIDKAAAQGLLSSDFQVNDEVVRFLGKRILEITYNAIEPQRKERIHERIGHYQENLYQQKLLPSAATLAYHFKRSTDHDKAVTYEKLLAASNSRNFNADEAVFYTGEALGEGPESDTPIRPEDVAMIPKVIRDFMVAVRNIKLYPPGSKSITGVISQSKQSLDRILDENDRLNLMQIKKGLVVNGQKMDVTDFRLVAQSFLQFLARYELKGISFDRGVTENELVLLIETFGRTREKLFDEHYWERFSTENRLQHIELKQVRYAMTGKPRPGVNAPPGKSLPGPAKGPESEAPASSGLDPAGGASIPSILKGLLGAAKIIKLYPITSKAVSGAIDQLLQRLNGMLQQQESLTISHAGETLLINGDRVDVSGFKTFAHRFVKFLDSLGLKSLAFTQGLKRDELERFIAILGELPSEGVDSQFWQKVGLAHILFDKHVYEIRVAQSQTPASGTSTVSVSVPSLGETEREEPIPEENFDEFLNEFQELIKKLFNKGAADKIPFVIQQLFLGLPERDLPIRERAVGICRNLLENLGAAYQHDFAQFLADPLSEFFAAETDPQNTVETAGLMNRLILGFIGFGDYPPAARIIAHLQGRLDTLRDLKDPTIQRLTKSLDIRLTSATQRLLVADLKSGDALRQRNAAQLLESLGQTVLPLLIDIIKQEEDYRARQTAAMLLAKQGVKAAKSLKRFLVLEIASEERIRILEIIDAVTNDLMTELTHCLVDENNAVRMAAFRLAARIKDERVVDLLMENAKTGRGELAVAAVNTLEKLKPPQAVDTLAALLKSSKEENLRLACCRALGQIAKPECIEPLSKVMNQKSLVLRRHHFSPQVRATAAFALGQIRHVRAVKILAGFVNDPDQRIREVSRTVIQKIRTAPRRKKAAVSMAK